MKIAFINHRLAMGSGIDVGIWEISKRLAKEHKVTIFTFDSEYKEDFGVEIKEIPIPLKNNRIVTGLFSPLFLHKVLDIRRYIKEYDVIITEIFPASIIPLYPTKIKCKLNIVVEWSTPVETYTKFTQKLYHTFLKKMNGYAVKNADVVIASSSFIKSWIKNEYGVVSEKLLIDGINFELFDKEKYFARKQEHLSYIYSKYPSLEGSSVILYVGGIRPHKNIDILIKSFRIVKKSIPSAKLLIIGRKSFMDYFRYVDDMVNAFNLRDSIIFADVVSWEDLPKYYLACDVYATCSAWEGFLRAEAYAMEKPMVAFDTTSHAETIQHEKTGLLVKEQTPEAFASALITLLNDNELRKRMGKEGYKWSKETLDFDVIAKNFMDFIKENV